MAACAGLPENILPTQDICRPQRSNHAWTTCERCGARIAAGHQKQCLEQACAYAICSAGPSSRMRGTFGQGRPLGSLVKRVFGSGSRRKLGDGRNLVEKWPRCETHGLLQLGQLGDDLSPYIHILAAYMSNRRMTPLEKAMCTLQNGVKCPSCPGLLSSIGLVHELQLQRLVGLSQLSCGHEVEGLTL